MKAATSITAALTALMMMTGAWACNGLPSEGVAAVTALTLDICDYSGTVPVTVTTGECPRRAMVISIVPEFGGADHHKYILDSPITSITISTPDGIAPDYAPGADVTHLFSTIPQGAVSNAESNGSPTETDPIVEWYEDRAVYKALTGTVADGSYTFAVTLTFADGTDMTAFTPVVTLI